MRWRLLAENSRLLNICTTNSWSVGETLSIASKLLMLMSLQSSDPARIPCSTDFCPLGDICGDNHHFVFFSFCVPCIRLQFELVLYSGPSLAVYVEGPRASSVL